MSGVVLNIAIKRILKLKLLHITYQFVIRIRQLDILRGWSFSDWLGILRGTPYPEITFQHNQGYHQQRRKPRQRLPTSIHHCHRRAREPKQQDNNWVHKQSANKPEHEL